jgi:hypothetical protein
MPAAIVNATVALLLISFGSGVVVSAIAGVAAGGAVNLLFNIPAIWRSWMPRPEERKLHLPACRDRTR